MRPLIRISSVAAILRAALLIFVLLPVLTPGARAATWFVDQNAPGPAHDGTTWATAFTSVQGGINAAASGEEVWVAKGTYSERITLNSGVALYGGFFGTETARDARNWTANVTILDAGGSGSVVTVPASAPLSTVLDGFTVRNGTGTLNSNGFPQGGGILCGNSASPTIRNNVITGNTALESTFSLYGRGGGIYVIDITDSPGKPVIENNTFTNNRANGSGAIYCARASATITGNLFQDNSAEGPGAGVGGVFLGSYSHAWVANNRFIHNVAEGSGGALTIYQNSQPTVVNNEFVSNEARFGSGAAIYTYLAGLSTSPARIISNVLRDNASYGGAIDTYGAVQVIGNTIVGTVSLNNGYGAAIAHYSARAISGNIMAFNERGVAANAGAALPSSYRNNDVFGNASGNYVNLPGGWDPTGSNGNVSVDPLFVNYAARDLHITAGSPCVDTGDQTLFPSDTPNDIDGQARVSGPQVDIGADEMTPVLGFAQQPGGAPSGAPLTPQPIVRAQDTAGNLIASFSGPVTLSLKAGTGTPGAVLGGTLTVNASGGLATFTDVSVNLGGAGYILTASSPGMTSATSAAFTATIPRAYVTMDGDDANEGRSWKAAKRTVAAALAVMPPGGQVWVAAGQYAGGFRLPSTVALYGGFRGEEKALEQRDPRAYETVLQGGSSVVSIIDAQSNTILDGFTIAGGVGRRIRSGTVTYNAGGGVYIDTSSAAVVNNRIVENTATVGAGIYAKGGSPRIERNIIQNNRAKALALVPGAGGGITLDGSNATLLSNIIARNASTGSTTSGTDSRAGGLGILSSSAVVRNNTIVGNEATDRSGGIDMVESDAGLVNNIIALNNGGVRLDAKSSAKSSHNDIFRNDAFDWDGPDNPIGINGNISEDPDFVDATIDYHLRAASPCVDAGNSSVVREPDLDIDGQPRIAGPSVDIGADEVPVVPFTLGDAALALRLFGGLTAAASGDVTRLDIETALTAGRIDLLDALHLARKSAGLESNP